jgi:Protein of unknown function (DUF2591)
MRKIKTSEATPLQLNWLVAKCEGKKPYFTVHEGRPVGLVFIDNFNTARYSTDWAQGGPIVDCADIQWCRLNGQIEAWSGFDYIDWRVNWDSEARMPDGAGFGTGSTVLIAAMRCYVASKIGDEVEVPEELA